MRRTIRGGIALPAPEPCLNNPTQRMSTPLSIGCTVDLPADVSLPHSVSVGQPLALKNGLPILSPIEGRLIRTDGQLLVHAETGMPEGPSGDESSATARLSPDKSVLELTPAELIDAVRTAAIPSLSCGAPLADRLQRADDASVYRVVIAAFETDPSMGAAERLLAEESEGLVGALKLLLSVFRAGSGVIAIAASSKYRSELTHAIGDFASKIKIRSVLPIYPSDCDRLVFSLVTGKELSYRRKPEDSGVLILSPLEALSIYRLFVRQMPFLETLISVSGDRIGEGGCWWVPIGAKISDLLELCSASDDGILYENGLLRGHPISRDSFVSPLTRSLTLISERRATVPPSSECIGCNRCFSVCPIYLSPRKILSIEREGGGLLAAPIESYRSDRSLKRRALGCIACGCCDYVCPSGIRLTERMVDLRNRLLQPSGSSDVPSAVDTPPIDRSKKSEQGGDKDDPV